MRSRRPTRHSQQRMRWVRTSIRQTNHPLQRWLGHRRVQTGPSPRKRRGQHRLAQQNRLKKTRLLSKSPRPPLEVGSKRARDCSATKATTFQVQGGGTLSERLRNSFIINSPKSPAVLFFWQHH